MIVGHSALLAEVSLFDPDSWFYAICKGVYWIVHAMEVAYDYLVGIKPITTDGTVE